MNTEFTQIILSANDQPELPRDFVAPGTESKVDTLIATNLTISIINNVDYVTIPMFQWNKQTIENKKKELLSLAQTKKYKSFSQCCELIKDNETGLVIVNCYID